MVEEFWRAMMRNKKLLAAAVATAIGVSIVPGTASAVIADGNYNMVIQQTPTFEYMGITYNDIGSDGAYNSSFTFGALPGTGSQPMTDNGTLVTGSDSAMRGSSVLEGDNTTAGTIGITMTGGTYTVNSFNIDAIFATAGGTFAQYANDLSGMGGTESGGTMTFDPTGRLAAISAPNVFFDRPWNINDWTAPCSSTTGCASNGNTTYATFTTEGSTNSAGTVHGSDVVNVGDINGDMIDDYTVRLVSASEVGTQWGGFASVPYIETWNIQILSSPAGVVPVPAAVWLFGSGLLGLVGVARRKKSTA